METLLNDIFHAQPYALLIIAGLVFIAIAVVGSIKTYINPGNIGRIAAGGVGAIMLIAGLVMYKAAPAPPTTTADEAVAKSVAVVHKAKSDAAAASAAGIATTSGSASETTTACYASKHWPLDTGKPMHVGDDCQTTTGLTGKAVMASDMCTYTSGPLKGTAQSLGHLAYAGYICSSTDHSSKGTVLVK